LLDRSIVSWANAANLVTSVLDLNLVRSLRAAIRSADLASGKRFPVAAIGPSPSVISPSLGFRSDASVSAGNIASAKSIEPDAHFLPKRVIKPEDRVIDPLLIPIHPEQPDRVDHPLQPPWKVLPWEQKNVVEVVIKRPLLRVDKAHKGTLIDLFC
jgi:hypothetical protein